MQDAKKYAHNAFFVALLLLLAACSQRSDVVPEARAGEVIPGQYIVALQAPELETQSSADAGLRVSQTATSLGVQNMGTLGSIDAFIASNVGERDLARLEADPRVRYVEPDRVVKLSGSQSNPAWGLDRIDYRPLVLDKSFAYAASGRGVNAYVIDSGIKKGHAEFGARLVGGVSAISDGRGYNDCHGHGTHVAGTLGGKTYGVAKSVKLYAVRVFGCGGTTSLSAIVTGIDWVTYNHKRPAVANLSLEAVRSSSVDAAVQAAMRAGVTVVAAAGNGSTNACNISPARVGSVLTVGASNAQDRRWSFSNYGSCLDLFAPGEAIRSAGLGGSRIMSGTSMAAPHVAGVAALVLQKSPGASPATVANRIKASATTGKLTLSNAPGSPNRLLFTAF
jgi:subtilisin family serine protease